MNKHFWNGCWSAVMGGLLFASVIWDMELSVGNSKRFVIFSVVLLGIAAYHLARGLQERASTHTQTR